MSRLPLAIRHMNGFSNLAGESPRHCAVISYARPCCVLQAVFRDWSLLTIGDMANLPRLKSTRADLPPTTGSGRDDLHGSAITPQPMQTSSPADTLRHQQATYLEYPP